MTDTVTIRAETDTCAVSAAIVQNRLLSVRFRDGHSHAFHPLWLRERAPDTETMDRLTGQRLIEATDLPLDIAVAAARVDGDAVALTFSDGHATRFPLADLERAAAEAGGPPAPSRRIWRGDLAPLPWFAAADVLSDDRALYDMMTSVETLGFALIQGLEPTMDGMAPLTDRIGPIRRTNWGGVADVKAIPNAYDLTMTSRALEPHADNPYRTPVQRYLLLHCIVNDSDGGESTLTDGFAVAERLRAEDPAAFEVLTRVRPRYRYADDTAHLENTGPLIELDPTGRVCQVRFSNRTELVEALPPADLDAFYRARQVYQRMICDPAMQVQFKLAPGSMFFVDNHRLLHGRRGYRMETGQRHMRQGYMERDIFDSRRRVLARVHGRADR